MAWKRVFVLVASLLITDVAVAGRRYTTEEANAEFFNEFKKEFRELRTRWSATHYCDYPDVTCDANGDVHVNLRGVGLSGEMPEVDDDWAEKTSIVEIDLSDNLNLRGDLEDDWEDLKQLRVLNLSYTSLRGEIPKDWKGMTSLEELYLHNTAVCRGLPKWEGKKMPNLRIVDLSNNHLYDSLRKEWSTITSLQELRLDGNHFCGCVPTQYEGNAVLMKAVSGLGVPLCSSKQSNSCSLKKYCPVTPNLETSKPTTTTTTSKPTTTTTRKPTTTTTSRPTESTNPPADTSVLLFLRRMAAAFGGPLSSWTGDDYCTWDGVLCSASGEVTVSLPDRGLSGWIPDAIGSPDSIVSIDLSGNSGISGSFPDSWAALKGLRRLDLSNTGLRGDIPSAWNGMVSLEQVYIRNTKACRNLPNWELPLLREIDFSSNNLKGVLVDSWSRMPNLQNVNLDGNAFCGCMPDSWKSNSVLVAAANRVNTALTSSLCAVSNRCGWQSFIC